MKVFVRLVFGLGTLVATTTAQVPVSEWTVIGTVGKWTYSTGGSQKTLVVGIQLTPGANRLSKEGNSKKSGSVTLLAAGVHYTIACDEPDSLLPDHSTEGCVSPIDLPPVARSSGQTSLIGSLWTEIQNLFQKEPDRFYNTVSRDFEGLSDAVVPVKDHSADLTGLLSGLSKGDYRLTFDSIPGGQSGGGSPAAQQLSFSWDPDAGKPLLDGSLEPGLYVAKAVTASGESAGSAWLLVVPFAEYKSKSELFKQVTDLTATWKGDSPTESIRAVNRATLSELAGRK